MPRWFKVFLGLTFGVLVLWGAVAGFTHHYMEELFIPKMEKMYSDMDATEKYRFINDLKTLEQNPPFLVTEKNNNAVTFLNQYVGWQGNEVEDPKSHQEDLVETLFEKAQQKAKAEGHEKTYLELSSFEEFEKIDISWMNELKHFDHWDFFQDQVIQDKLAQTKDTNFLQKIEFISSYPIPNFSIFYKYAQLRFLKEVGEDSKRAFENLDHSLKLVYSNNSLISSMVAANGLRFV